jgi:3-hydroxyisobutyrate dehydrogenase
VLESNGIAFVDAPVSGAVAGARDATRAIMAGGEKSALEKARPVLEALGKGIFHVGPLGAGHAVKALNNYLGAAGTLAGFEALLIAQAFGLDPQPMLEAINASTGRNSTTEKKIGRDVLTGAYASGFKLALMTKDVGIAASLARDVGVRTPFLEQTLRMWREAKKRLAKDADHSEIYKYQAQLSRRRSAAARRKSSPSRGAASPRPGSRRKRRRST